MMRRAAATNADHVNVIIHAVCGKLRHFIASAHQGVQRDRKSAHAFWQTLFSGRVF